jgi:L-aspartate-alpha-decarboxylase
MTLKFKIIAIISGLLLSASVVSSVINYQIDVKTTQTQLKNISLPLSLDNIYTEIQQRMIEPMIVSSLMSNDIFLKDWIKNGERFSTYIILGERGKRDICLNGAAARKVHKGDKVIIVAYATYDEKDLQTYKPKVVILDDNNDIDYIADSI